MWPKNIRWGTFVSHPAGQGKNEIKISISITILIYKFRLTIQISQKFDRSGALQSPLGGTATERFRSFWR